MTDELTLKVDADRRGIYGETGIYVRALDGEKWTNADIADLTYESLNEWLRSRGGENEWAESVVCILLGHPAPTVATEGDGGSDV